VKSTQSRRSLLLTGGASLALYLLYFYVPISAAHTVPINHLRPLGAQALGGEIHVEGNVLNVR